MAKELPYFKFEPSEWLEGDIQLCSFEAQCCFINLSSGYWLKLGDVSYAFALHKYCNRNADVLQELINNEIVTLENDKIYINFLDEQLKEFNETSEKRRNAANKRWKNASALQVQSKSNAIREDKRREEEIKKDKFNFKKSLLSLCDDEQIVNDYLQVRKNKKATNSKTSFNQLKKQFELCTIPVSEILTICIEKDWKGFKAEWLNNIGINKDLQVYFKFDFDADGVYRQLTKKEFDSKYSKHLDKIHIFDKKPEYQTLIR